MTVSRPAARAFRGDESAAPQSIFRRRLIGFVVGTRRRQKSDEKHFPVCLNPYGAKVDFPATRRAN